MKPVTWHIPITRCHPTPAPSAVFAACWRTRINGRLEDQCPIAPAPCRSASADRQSVVLSHEELSLLLNGMDLERVSRRRWYRKVAV